MALGRLAGLAYVIEVAGLRYLRRMLQSCNRGLQYLMHAFYYLSTLRCLLITRCEHFSLLVSLEWARGTLRSRIIT